jgi:hypothetical protein
MDSSCAGLDLSQGQVPVNVRLCKPEYEKCNDMLRGNLPRSRDGF